MSNNDKLKNLLVDVFLLDPAAVTFQMKREDIDSWDSLGVVSLEVGLKETFGVPITPQEAMAIKSVQDILTLLTSKGIDFSS